MARRACDQCFGTYTQYECERGECYAEHYERQQEERFLHELDLVAPNIRASHNNTVFTRSEIMQAFRRYLDRLSPDLENEKENPNGRT